MDVAVKTKTNNKTKRQPPYAIILHDDEKNSTVWVTYVLQEVFGYEFEKCHTLMMAAHENGQSQIWSGTRELAELKAEQIESLGGDPSVPKANKLRVSLEPLE